MTEELVFRGLRGRTFDDQVRAIEAGYASVIELAIDELGQLILDLRERVARLEQATTVRSADAAFLHRGHL